MKLRLRIWNVKDHNDRDDQKQQQRQSHTSTNNNNRVYGGKIESNTHDTTSHQASDHDSSLACTSVSYSHTSYHHDSSNYSQSNSNSDGNNTIKTCEKYFISCDDQTLRCYDTTISNSNDDDDNENCYPKDQIMSSSTIAEESIIFKNQNKKQNQKQNLYYITSLSCLPYHTSNGVTSLCTYIAIGYSNGTLRLVSSNNNNKKNQNSITDSNTNSPSSPTNYILEKQINDAHRKGTPILKVKWNSSDKLCTCGQDGFIKIWFHGNKNLVLKREYRFMESIYSFSWGNYFHGVSESAIVLGHGNHLSIVQASTLHTYNTNNDDGILKSWQALNKGCGVILSVDWSLRNNLILCASEGDYTCKIFDPYGNLIRIFHNNNQQPISIVKWRPQGDSFLVGSFNELCLVDHEQTAKVLDKCIPHKEIGSIVDIDWCCDGSEFMAVSLGGYVLIGHCIGITKRNGKLPMRPSSSHYHTSLSVEASHERPNTLIVSMSHQTSTHTQHNDQDNNEIVVQKNGLTLTLMKKSNKYKNMNSKDYFYSLLQNNNSLATTTTKTAKLTYKIKVSSSHIVHFGLTSENYLIICTKSNQLYVVELVSGRISNDENDYNDETHNTTDLSCIHCFNLQNHEHQYISQIITPTANIDTDIDSLLFSVLISPSYTIASSSSLTNDNISQSKIMTFRTNANNTNTSTNSTIIKPSKPTIYFPTHTSPSHATQNISMSQNFIACSYCSSEKTIQIYNIPNIQKQQSRISTTLNSSIMCLDGDTQQDNNHNEEGDECQQIIQHTEKITHFALSPQPFNDSNNSKRNRNDGDLFIAFLDIKNNLYISKLNKNDTNNNTKEQKQYYKLNSDNDERIKVMSFVWNGSSHTFLSALISSDKKYSISTWFFPKLVFMNTDLFQMAMEMKPIPSHIIDKITNNNGSQICPSLVSHSSGYIVGLKKSNNYEPHQIYPILYTSLLNYPTYIHSLFLLGNKTKQALQLAFLINRKEIWAIIAGYAFLSGNLDLDMAEIAYGQLKVVEKMKYIKYIKSITHPLVSMNNLI